MTITKKTAFSLIELSIVILVVGILVAGVTQASRLLSAAKVSVAQRLTESSAVAGIKNLALWLESSTEASFPLDMEEGDVVTAWNDINPQTPHRLYALRSSTDTSLQYHEGDKNTIGNLPSIHFSGDSTQALILCRDDDTSTINSTKTPIITPDNAFTLVMVVKTDFEPGINSTKAAILNGTHTPVGDRSGWSYYMQRNADGNHWGTHFIPGLTSPSSHSFKNNTPHIISIEYTGDTGVQASRNYFNGSLVGSSNSSTAMTTPSPSLVIGAFSEAGITGWTGYMSEIIIYSRSLKREERYAVESYLGQKYGITVTQS